MFPQDHGGLSKTILNLFWKPMNMVVGSGLVNASANCVWARICWICRWFATTFYLTKCISSSICLVLAWKIEFGESNTTLWLSHNKVGTRYLMCSSKRRDSSLATSTCFFELQDWGQRKHMNPRLSNDHQGHLPNQSHYRHTEKTLEDVCLVQVTIYVLSCHLSNEEFA